MAPDLVDDRLELGLHRLEVRSVGEGVLGPDRLADPVGAYRAFVDAARDPVIIGAGLAECCCRKARRLRFRSSPVLMPSRSILALVAGPMPWNFPTGRVSTKPGPISGVMTKRPIRLALVGGELGEELVVGDAGRGGQAGLGPDPRPGSPGDLGRRGDPFRFR